MNEYTIKVLLLDEALTFVRSLPLKVQEKIVYNYKKIENGLINKDLFKKLENTEIWEFRTLYNGNCYRLFSFWDTEAETLIIATHGIMKKSQKTPSKEIAKAETIREEYFKNK
ncbi:MAG: type II toxin-antitoxin system RelE/ParE family toxin [Muribaculaceae bacterium]